jgi:hypothetical protein
VVICALSTSVEQLYLVKETFITSGLQKGVRATINAAIRKYGSNMDASKIPFEISFPEKI